MILLIKPLLKQVFEPILYISILSLLGGCTAKNKNTTSTSSSAESHAVRGDSKDPALDTFRPTFKQPTQKEQYRRLVRDCRHVVNDIKQVESKVDYQTDPKLNNLWSRLKNRSHQLGCSSAVIVEIENDYTQYGGTYSTTIPKATISNSDKCKVIKEILQVVDRRAQGYDFAKLEGKRLKCF